MQFIVYYSILAYVGVMNKVFNSVEMQATNTVTIINLFLTCV